MTQVVFTEEMQQEIDDTEPDQRLPLMCRAYLIEALARVLRFHVNDVPKVIEEMFESDPDTVHHALAIRFGEAPRMIASIDAIDGDLVSVSQRAITGDEQRDLAFVESVALVREMAWVYVAAGKAPSAWTDSLIENLLGESGG